MNIDENEYFRQASLSICGNLNVEKAMLDFIRYLRRFMPADHLYLQKINQADHSITNLAAVSQDEIMAAESPSLLPENAFQIIEDCISNNISVLRMNNPFLGQGREMTTIFPPRQDQSFLMLNLWLNEAEIAVLTVQANGWDRHTEHHEHLLKILRDLFKVAMTNILQYRKIIKLHEMLLDENRYLKEELNREQPDVIVGRDQGLKQVMDQVERVCHLDSPVLLLGETGVGKELFANAIHYASPRKNHPFIKVNAGAIPENLMDSELFGHEKGAFTGAVSLKRGRFERAQKGTIFLDEIGELTPQAQVHLLRVLQHKVIERVGGSKPIAVDVRIISATHRNLEEMVKSGHFREDLFYRLNVFPITIPPLRERREDIPALVHHFIQKKSIQLRLKKEPVLGPGAMERLISFGWPGNIRELENVIERELINRGSHILTFNSLATHNRGKQISPPAYNENAFLSLDEVDANHIKRALMLTNGQIHGIYGAARRLQIHPNTLRSRMKKLGIPFGFGRI